MRIRAKNRGCCKFKEILKNANPEQVDELIEGMEKLLAEYNNDFDRLIEEIEDLAGNAIPVCWPKTYPDLNGKDAERLFTIRLQPKGNTNLILMKDLQLNMDIWVSMKTIIENLYQFLYLQRFIILYSH